MKVSLKVVSVDYDDNPSLWQEGVHVHIWVKSLLFEQLFGSRSHVTNLSSSSTVADMFQTAVIAVKWVKD